MGNKIVRAVAAKLRDKDNLPSWYEERRSKCSGCEFNTKNINKLSLKDKFRVAHNLGKDACVVCTCGIDDLSSDPLSSCSKGFWGEEKVYDLEKLSIKTDSYKAKLTYNEVDKRYVLDYGEISRGYNSLVELFIEDNDLDSALRVTTSCGCTAATPKKKGDGTSLEITYDTKRVGSFSKNVNIFFSKKKNNRVTVVTIKGNVKN